MIRSVLLLAAGEAFLLAGLAAIFWPAALVVAGVQLVALALVHDDAEGADR